MTTPTDPFSSYSKSIDGPGGDAFAITPSDSVNFLTMARGLYVGGTGDITIVTAAGSVVLFSAVPAGAILPVRCSRVNSTATTATNIVGLV